MFNNMTSFNMDTALIIITFLALTLNKWQACPYLTLHLNIIQSSIIKITASIMNTFQSLLTDLLHEHALACAYFPLINHRTVCRLPTSQDAL